MVTLSVNGTRHELDIEPETPLLWVLRDELGLTGTKFGCGIAQCGACTVHMNGVPVRSCQMPVGGLAGVAITTIEGLSPPNASTGTSHAVQRAWVEADVPQCGYCQSGQIMAAVALLAGNKTPSDSDIDAAMTNICRCGTYPRIRAAIHRAAELAKG
jgi:isoquinoline 1-oxidoreductase alpha subunit